MPSLINRVPLPCDKQNMLAWVNGLLSKRFPQGKGTLRRNFEKEPSTFCCLGVACEVAIEAGVELEAEHPKSGLNNASSYDDVLSDLPHKAMVWLGLNSTDPVIGFDDAGFPICAIQANDSRRLSFEQIAQSLIMTYGLGQEVFTDGTDGNDAAVAGAEDL